MNRQYLRPYGVESITKFQSQYTIKNQIGTGGQATVYNVSPLTNPTTTSYSKCVKLFKIDTTDFKKSIKKFYQLINLYYIIHSNNISDYYSIYGNCDTTVNKWTGIIILMKKYHHTLSDKQYWTDTTTHTTASATIHTTEGEPNNNESNETELMNGGYMIGNNYKFISKLISDLFEHLSLMHNLNIVHNDIKPDNIVFDIDENKWKLIDFDLSMVVEHNGTEGIILHSKYRGSAYYSAPEILINGNRKNPSIYSKSGDLWSFGMVVCWCILRRNHIWYFINFILENGQNKIKNKSKYAYYYFNDIIKCKNEEFMKCILKYGMNGNMNNCIYKLLDNMLINDFRKRKSIKYLKCIEIKEN